MQPVEVTPGSSPVVLAMPHSGTWVPDEIFAQLNETGQKLRDTDWHIDRLYDGLLPGASIVKANFHRYVIDANRDPEGKSLYPGQNTTDLCPLTDFDNQPIWKEGMQPDAQAIQERLEKFHTPYHNALSEMLEIVEDRHGFAILYDCHSIRSFLPFLFEGTLPTLNIGTNDGHSCAPPIQRVAQELCEESSFGYVVNGRFKGGWTTRCYGQPKFNIHAIQMEITQSAYMQEEAPWEYLPERAESLRLHLKELLSRLSNLNLVRE